MDPKAAYNRCFELLDDGELIEARWALDDLLEWRNRGGWMAGIDIQALVDAVDEANGASYET